MPLPQQPSTKVLAISSRIHRSSCPAPRLSDNTMSSEALRRKVRVICTDPDATESSSDEEASLAPKRLVREICLPAGNPTFWAADCDENWGYGALPRRILQQDLLSVSIAAESSLRRPRKALGRKRSCKPADEDAAEKCLVNCAASLDSFPEPQYSQKVKNARRVSRQYRRVRQRRRESPDTSASRTCGKAGSVASCSSAGSGGADHDGLCSASNREFGFDGGLRTAAREDSCLRDCCDADEVLGSPNDDAGVGSWMEQGHSSSSKCLVECLGRDSPSSVLETAIAYRPVPLPSAKSGKRPCGYFSDFSEELVLQPNVDTTEKDVVASVSSNRMDTSLHFAPPESSGNGVGIVATPIVEDFPLFLAEFGQLFGVADAEGCEIGKTFAFDSFDLLQDDTDIIDISLDFDSEALTWINTSEVCVI